ncbi:acyl-CoA synthetase (AMP-forming)/AMP-acid ligase II [Kibdelosporangium banguiense]|uniref:Acyl-CoA synthetase (AMP-forming)/AMP-acid ligase II n=1 Tax=Kibdelosporangium banguiense TaxID=1365924 RepID=A0ABS4TPC8_9PSEU|nr:class I adenylate-forming enzyme family protein [Kibdelosporangium banguiense]MBP2325820.1 acyl-CoA synthetase (AMP-forming)/AMP-acid ligase II [Kibdelosporangium banguiense]
MGSTAHQRILTVPELLADRAFDEPERAALIVAGVGTLTFREWDERSDAAAHGLIACGVGRGEKVGLVFGARDWLDFAVTWTAVLKAGAVAVPISDRMAPVQRDEMLVRCGATAVLYGQIVAPPAGPGWAGTAAQLQTGTTGQPDVRVELTDPAQILFTSGTTGRPKGVRATHANLGARGPISPKRRAFAHSKYLLHAFPIGTNAGQVMLTHALTAAPAVVTLPQFTPARFARLIESYSAGTVFVVPAMATELLSAGIAANHDLSSVLLLGSAASALPPKVAAGLVEAFPNATITNYYTSTEASPAQTIMIYDPQRPSALGRPAAGSELKVADSNGVRLSPGETGEVWLRAGPYSRSYHGEEDSQDTVFRDGWVRMGDLGYVDEDGFLHLVDRDSDVIKSGAFKVPTLQVEAELYEHPDVTEAAVFGISHPVMGMAVAAAVVATSPISLAGVRSFLGERLAQHELPTRLLVLDRLPRNDAGKVIKQTLRRIAKE